MLSTKNHPMKNNFNIVNFFIIFFLISSHINAMQSEKDKQAFLKSLIAGDISGVATSLANGMDVNAEFDETITNNEFKKITPLGIAVFNNHIDIINLLLIHQNIDVNKSYLVKTIYGKINQFTYFNPLLDCIVYNKKMIFNILISYASIQCLRQGLFHASSYMHGKEYIEIFINLGLSPNLLDQTWRFRTPLISAVVNKQFENVKFLYEKGADLNFIDDEGKTALDYCFDDTVEKNFVEEIKINKFLLQNGAISGEYLKKKQEIKNELSKVLPSEFENLLNLTTNYCM